MRPFYIKYVMRPLCINALVHATNSNSNAALLIQYCTVEKYRVILPVTVLHRVVPKGGLWCCAVECKRIVRRNQSSAKGGLWPHWACEVGAEKWAKIRLCLGPDVPSRPPREGASFDPSEGGSAPRPPRHKGALGGPGGAILGPACGAGKPS